jgi:hypothetical protein
MFARKLTQIYVQKYLQRRHVALTVIPHFHFARLNISVVNLFPVWKEMLPSANTIDQHGI